MYYSQIYIICLSLAIIARFIHTRYKTHLRSQLPAGLRPLPGPKGIPLVGSILDVPENVQWLQFSKWAEEYGQIYQVNLAGTNHVWISSDRIARDLLGKKPYKYSNRPHIPALLADNRKSGQYLPLLNHNGYWARQKKFASGIMGESKRNDFYETPELESVRMCVELSQRPNEYGNILESYIARVTSRLAWGRSEASDELKQRARELLISVSPNGHIGNLLPVTMASWIPDWLSPPKAWERRRARTEREFFEKMQNVVQKDVSNGVDRPSWMRKFIADSVSGTATIRSDLEAAYAVGMHGIAGALTVAAPLQVFCVAMCEHPEILSDVQAELDRACPNRLPTQKDRPNLPLLRAVMKECIRWRPPVPTGIPRELSEDDEYEGQFIPAGSVIHPFEWRIARDPELYPDPEAFNPYRWLEPQYPTYREPLTEFPTIVGMTQFGYGKRICVGQAVTEADLLVGMGAMAWAFDISRPGKGDRDEPEPELAMEQEQQEMEAEIEEREANKRNAFGSLPGKAKLAPPMFPRADSLYSDSEDEVDTHSLGSSAGSSPTLSASPELPSEKIGLARKPGKPLAASPDQTLAFSKLLIAKPLSFEFDLQPRSPTRLRYIFEQYTEQAVRGEWAPARSFWGPNQGAGEKLGWGKV